MAIPEKTLTLDFGEDGIDDLTLDEMCMLSPGEFDAVEFRKFLRARSNWTPAEIGKLKRAELSQVRASVIDRINELAVPLAK